MMKKGLLYIHGQGGSAQEAEHYKILFPDCNVMGLDYRSQTPWEAQKEFPRMFDLFSAEHTHVSVIANSIGAFFTMHALNGKPVEKAWFISPVVNMERLIAAVMQRNGISEHELMERGTVKTPSGEILSWEYLSWVREHPLSWSVPTSILCGEKDYLQSPDTVQTFAGQIGADVTVMKNGEHWFHTPEQMNFLDHWMQS